LTAVQLTSGSGSAEEIGRDLIAFTSFSEVSSTYTGDSCFIFSSFWDPLL
jgi:hypothetical protein